MREIMSKVYLIVQHPTGFADGYYYMPKDRVEEIAKNWDERFPDCSHVVVTLVPTDKGFLAIPDETFIPRAATNAYRKRRRPATEEKT